MKTSRTCVCLGLLVLLFSFVNKPVYGQLQAQFTSNLQSGCPPLIVAFQDQSTGGSLSYKWTLGNGATSTLQNPVTTYFDAGVYTVKLVIKNSTGSDSVTKVSYITVYANPQASFTATPTQGCYPLDVNFTDNSKAGSGTISEYLWDLGDGNISTDPKPSHTYTVGGTFDVTLKVTNSFGCSNVITRSDLVHIDNGVNAGFTLTSLNVCTSPATAVFRSSSSGSGTLTYDWDFGDGKTGTVPSPTHQYLKSGNYNVLLTVQSSAGCSDTASMPLTIDLPASSFTTDATCSNQNIHFTNTSVPAPISTRWYFGDGTSSTALDPDKIYSKTGNYTVKLVNVFSPTCSDSITKVINIASGPSASFFADDTARCSAPLTVNFTNSTTGSATQYSWDFGDGTKSQDVNPIHTYTKSGIFTVTLTAINSNGCQDVFTKANYIYIQPVKVVNLLDVPDSGCVPLPVHPRVQLNINARIKNYSWDFGDGTTSSAASPSHTYTKEGFFNIKVTIETFDGCTDSYIKTNAVLAGHRPKANFTWDYDTICANQTLVFQNTSTNGPITFLQWDFGDVLDSASGEYYNVDASDTGYRPVTLVAFNYGCSDTLHVEKSLYVAPPIAIMDFTMHCDNKRLVDFFDSSIVDITHKWDFGDGKTDTAKNPKHTYASAGVYTVNLYTANKSCRDTATSTIHVINEVGVISLASDIYCRGNNMVADITGVDLANVKNTKWDFGDGTVVTVNSATKASHRYIVTGKFKIKATMTDLNNCQYLYESKDSITILGPLSNFLSAQPGICQGGSVSFTDKSQTDGMHELVKWEWDYGDKVNRVYNKTTGFSHTYPDTGYYTIRLTVTDSYGCSDSLRKTNYVYVSHPYASFLIPDSIACPGKQVAFQNTSTGKDLKSFWEFGDGGESTQTNPSYTYYVAGIYSPQLSVTDINGCIDSFQLNSLKISSPHARFNMSDSFSTCPPLQVNFANRSLDYNTITWDFGDGSTSSLPSPVHIYTYPGIYPVILFANGYGSCADTLKKNVVIKGPTGTMTYDSLPVCYPSAVQFSANTSNTSLYTWDFSDGNTVTTLTGKTSHTYDAGSYVPQMILADSLGCDVLIKGRDTVKVYDVQAKAQVVGNPACDSSLVQFIDQSSSGDSIVHRLWYFGDKDSADANMIYHMYTNPGSYDARLVAVTLYGCRDSFDIPAPVVILPTPDISILGASSACASAAINFSAGNNVADSSSITWNWDLGNGTVTSGQSVSSSYMQGGTYTVKLIGVNGAGCADTTRKAIKINAAPFVDAGPDTSVCQHTNYQLTVRGAQSYVWSGSGLSCTNCTTPQINTDTSAAYFVTGTDLFGCKASDTVQVRVIEPGAITVNGGDTLCVGESTQFSASGAQSYQWSPSLFLDNARSSQPVFRPMADTSINFKVIGYTEHNCFSDTGYVFVKAYPVPQMDIRDNEIELDAGSSVRLSSNSSADITQWQWQPQNGLDDPHSANPLASPKQTITYACIASNGGGCVARDEITIHVVCKNTNIFIPNTFSPNNDGMNDKFFPRGRGLFSVKSFRIFNRWGQLIFERFNVSPNSAADGWDGTYNGKPVSSDVYVYMMEIICENNTSIPIKGNVTVLK